MKIYPIGGGKGGVGKSFITASLGALIAKRGNKVVLIDLDLGTSNLHTFLGIKGPKSGINSFLNKTAEKLERVAVPTNIPNLFFISSLHCSMEIANLFYAQKMKLINAIRKLPFEYILLDLGAGTNFNTLDFFLTSNEGIFICTPEPTSIENAFRFIKAVYLRKLKQLIKQHAFNSAVKNVVSSSELTALKSPDIFDIILKYDPEKERLLKDRISKFNFKFILNQFRKNLDTTLGEKVETVCNRHFYSTFQFLGNISQDELVFESVFSKKLYVQKYPYTTTSVDLRKIADVITQNRPSASVFSKIS
ncbi:P-loop NTPase [Thermodesulfobacteriota bacterium]